MTAELTAHALARLPFPRQVAAIDRAIAFADPAVCAPLLAVLAGLPDHEPLAHAVRSLAARGALADPRLHTALRDALLTAPDTGIQRVLRGLDRADLAAHALRPVCDAVAHGLETLPLARIGALCVMNRWLKNADRPRCDRLRDDAIGACTAATTAAAIAAIPDPALVRLPGERLASLAARFEAAGLEAAWAARLGRFARDVLALLRDAPRSLSQANAEELLSRRVYTDPGHFLVELLQNAEDAGARTFRVAIDAAAVSTWHDGAPFDARDVVGVLSIGQTTKSSEQIGFFGVGFKSVYEVCERPQVYSDLFSFEIADFAIARPLPERPASVHPDGGTLLVLPLRQPHDPTHAPAALTARALAVPPETLLTLTHLRRFDLLGPNATRTVTRADDPGQHRVRLVVDTGAGPPPEVRSYLVAAGARAYDGPTRELSRTMTARSLVAIRLDADGVPTAPSPEAPTVFSHLPTGERSGLRFLVHSHFEVPVDRERLNLASPWNRWALTQAGGLLADAAERHCAGPDVTAAALDGLLDVIALPAELSDPAYVALAAAARPRLAALPLLPGAAGQRLTPATGRLFADPALAAALADAPLDADGGRACAALGPRRAEVALNLGARRFDARDLAQLLTATLAGAPEGGPYPSAWLGAAIGPVLTALGEAIAALDAAALAGLALLPDDSGCAWRPGTIRRTTPALRALYASAGRPFLAVALDAAPTLAQATLLQRLGVAHHDDRAFVADLIDPALGGGLLAAAGALAVHRHLASLGRALTADLARHPLFPTVGGGLHPLVAPAVPAAPAAPAPAWLAPTGPLRAVVLALPPDRRPPLVATDLGDALPGYLRDLGGRTLDLRALLQLLATGEVRLEEGDLGRLHTLLDAGLATLTHDEREALRVAAVFPDQTGTLRPLRGPRRVHLPADAATEALVPDAPWLAVPLRGTAHVAALGPQRTGCAQIIAGLTRGADATDAAGGPAAPPLLTLAAVTVAATEAGDTLRDRLFAYLTAQADAITPAEAAALAATRLWAAAAPSDPGLDVLAARRGPIEDPDRALLLALLAPVAPLAAADLRLVAALHLDPALAPSTSATLILRLGEGFGDDLAATCAATCVNLVDVRAALARQLALAARTLDRAQLAPLLHAALFRGEDGLTRRPGRWADPPEDAVYRVPAPLRAALSGGARPLMHPDDDEAFGPALAVLGVVPADLTAFVAALGADGALTDATAATCAQARQALVHLAAALTASPDHAELAARVAQLPLWPTVAGPHLPAAAVVRPADVVAILGPEAARDLVAGAPGVLAEYAAAEAAQLSAVVRFKAPVALLQEQVAALAHPGVAVEAQPPLFADRRRLVTLLQAVREGLGDDAAAATPLWVSAAGLLTTGPLFALAADSQVLTRGLALQATVAETAWVAAGDAIGATPLSPLPAQRLLAALAEAARQAGDAAPPPLADAAGRAAFYAFLSAHAAELEASPQALGTLGNAPLLLTEAGGWRAPRDLLLGDDVGASLPDDIGLSAWRPAPELPAALRRWLHEVVQLERGRRTQLMAVLVDAHRQAEADADAARSAALLAAMAGCWPPSDAAEDAVAFDWSVRNHKLRRLRIATDGGGEGGWQQIGRLLSPTAAERPLLTAFLSAPVELASAVYDAPVVVALLGRIGAGRSLPAARLAALLTTGDGLAPGLAASLALSRYLALVAHDRPAALAALDLAHTPWVPDGRGARRAPSALYWPTDDVIALVGADPERFPHEEFFVTMPQAVSDALPFRRAADAVLADVLRAVAASPAGARAEALAWLDRGLASGALGGAAVEAEAEAIRAVFRAPRLRDDEGVLRRADELVLTPAPELIGDALRGWQDGEAWPALARALQIPEQVGPAQVRRYLEDLARRLDAEGSAQLLSTDPGLRQRLPRGLERVARDRGRPLARVALLATEADGTAVVTTHDDPRLALPQPLALATAVRAAALPLRLVAEGGGRGDAAVARWLRDAGVPDLWALFTRDPAPAQVAGDLTAAHADAVQTLRAALVRALAQPVLAQALGMTQGQEILVRVAAPVTVTGRLLGHALSVAVGARYDADRQRLVVLPASLSRRSEIAAAMVSAVDALSEAREAWAEALVDAMAGAEIAAPRRAAASALRPELAAPRRAPSGPATAGPDAPGKPSGGREPRSLWTRVRGWLGAEDSGPAERDAPRPSDHGDAPEPPPPREQHAGSGAQRPHGPDAADPEDIAARPMERPDQGRWFEASDAVEAQLNSQGTFARDRAVAAAFGFKFSPLALPFPHAYAPMTIAGEFHRPSQTWRAIARGVTAALVLEGGQAAAAGRAVVALTGRLPRGTNLFPLPLYGRLERADGAGVRLMRGRAGRSFIVADGPADLTCRVVLDQAPAFERPQSSPTAASPLALKPLLERTVPDSELPDEALQLVEDLRVSDEAALDKALAVRRFIQTRYRYDPSYLEDAAVARWLRRVTRGRPNLHIAALHAGGSADGRYLGRGVCFELGVMACELLRRAGIPAAVAKGWVWQGGQLADPDHLWAMALLPSDVGLRWAPIDPATRDGQALRVPQRPAGDWHAPAPATARDLPDAPSWSERDDDGGGDWDAPPPSRDGRGSTPPPAGQGPTPARQPGAPRGAGPGPVPVGGVRQPPRAPRRAAPSPQVARPPIGELMRVVKHLAELSGESLEGQALYRRCRQLLADPAQAAALLEAMGLGDGRED